MKRCAALFAGVILLALLAACAAQPAEQVFFAMDTVMRVRIWHGDQAADDAAAVQALVASLEQSLSVTEDSSEVSQLNAAGAGALSEDTLYLLERSLDLSARTDGALDVTLYAVVQLWGFTTGDYRVPSEAEIAQALSTTGADRVSISGSTVTLREGTMLDFGAVAKGEAAQRAAALLAERGAEAAILSFGGNVQTLGEKPDGTDWQIAVQDPFDETAAAVTLSLAGSHAIVTSGGYQRNFSIDGVTYHHIMDPETGAPARSGLSSVTIVADDGFLADGLSTALYVMGLEEAAAFWRESDDFEAVLIDDTGTVYVTQGLADRVSGGPVQVIER